ncbi:MAG: hypothetical protein EOM64_04920 [Erysipelotrichia bacterium]|nr:hypothetical protein [Erysipelotrichia bacterium]
MDEQIAVTAASVKEAKILKDAGADEVILPLAAFSVTDLSEMTLKEIQNFSEASILMNRLLFPEEMEIAEQYIKEMSSMNLKHIYFSDPAVIRLAEQHGLVSKLIYKPDTLLTSPEDAVWWLNRKIDGVAVSPLLTLEEARAIATVKRNCIFTIHGRLMMSVSRRKLLSAYMESKGIEQQTCFENITIQEINRSEHLPVYENEHGTLIETDYVLQSFGIVDELVRSGAYMFLVEHSGMSTEETADAIRGYRDVFSGCDPDQIKEDYIRRHPAMILSEGYYMEKTIR